MYSEESNIVDLNIGGTHMISTSKSTLTKFSNSALAAMFSGRHKLSHHNGRVFIDRDGDAFVHLITYLRTGKVPLFKTKAEENAFNDELDYWGVPLQLKDSAEIGSVDRMEFDPNWYAQTLVLDGHNSVVKKT